MERQTLEKATIRHCRKAQSFVRPFNQKKKVKAGTCAQQKMARLIEMTKENDFGELTVELETLDKMIKIMQLGVLEALLEPIETIERRMKSYQKTVTKKEEELNDSATSIDVQEVDNEILLENFHKSDRTVETSQTSQTADSTDGWSDTDDEIGMEISKIQQDRFMDRLQNFFAVKHVAEERMKTIDPQGKIAAMKVRPHIRGGIQEKNGTFKSGCRQVGINGKPVRHLSDLYVAAGEASSAFQSVMDSLRSGVPDLESRDVEVCQMKQHSRAARKAQEEFAFRKPGPAEAWLYDILRGSVICKSFKQLNAVNKYLKENVHIVDCVNRFADPQFDGYRDIVYYVSVPYKDEMAFICEIQVHHAEFKKHFGGSSHRKQLRRYFADTSREPADLLKDLEMLRQKGQVNHALMEFLLQATDPEQLKFFARIFFEELGETKLALTVFERVLDLEVLAYDDYDCRMGKTYVYLGRVLLEQGNTDEALNCLRNARTIFMDAFGPKHPQIASTLVVIGEAYRSGGDFVNALREQQAALQMRKKCLGSNHILVAESSILVAKAQCDQGHYKDSLTTCLAALQIQESVAREDSVESIESWSAIGAIFALEGELKKAIKSYQEALSIQKKLYGTKDIRIAHTLTEIGHLKMKQNKLSEAEVFHQKALHIRETILGKSHPDCAISHRKIGMIQCMMGENKNGFELLSYALRLTIKGFGKCHLVTSDCFADIGAMMVKKNDYDDAIHQYEACLDIRRDLFGKSHPKYAESLVLVGHVDTMRGDFKIAERSLNKALSIFEQVFGPNHPDVARTYEHLGIASERQMRYAQSLEYQAQALSIRNDVLGTQHSDTISSCFAVGGLLETKEDFAEARTVYEQALDSCLSLHGENHIDTARARLRLGSVLVHQNEFGNAQEELRKVLSIGAEEELRNVLSGEAINSAMDLHVAEACYLLGAILNEEDDLEEAISLHKRALEIRKQKLEKDDPLVIASLDAIAILKYSNYIV